MLTGSDVKQARNGLGETQAAFGERFGVDQATVHRWETAGLPSRGAARKAVEQFLQAIREASPTSEPEPARNLRVAE
jgi:transcriptional regulator with XRE-family HTH domain